MLRTVKFSGSDPIWTKFKVLSFPIAQSLYLISKLQAYIAHERLVRLSFRMHIKDRMEAQRICANFLLRMHLGKSAAAGLLLPTISRWI